MEKRKRRKINQGRREERETDVTERKTLESDRYADREEVDRELGEKRQWESKLGKNKSKVNQRDKGVAENSHK